MKAVIKDGMLVDEQGFELYPNKVYLYGSGFKNIIEDLPEGAEVNIKNVWDTKTLYSDNAKILFGGCLDFDYNIKATPYPTIPDDDETEEQIVINEPNITLINEDEVTEDGNSGCNFSNQSSGLSDSELSDTVQNESDNA